MATEVLRAYPLLALKFEERGSLSCMNSYDYASNYLSLTESKPSLREADT